MYGLIYMYTFQGIDALAVTTEENEPGSFHGDFHMEFCDNRKQLFQAYFRDFTIERLDNPWQAFTGGWHLEVSKFIDFWAETFTVVLID